VSVGNVPTGTDLSFSDASFAGTAFSFVVSGTNIVLQVTGLATATILWQSYDVVSLI